MEASKYIKSQRTRKRRRKTLAIFLVLSALLILFLGKAPFFNITHVTVAVDEKGVISEESILDKLKGVKGKNIFNVKRVDIEKVLKGDPYIKKLTVTKKLPNSVKIQVEENTRMFTIEKSGSFYIVGSTGRLLEKTQSSVGLNTISLEGVGVDGVNPSDYITSNEQTLHVLQSFGELLETNTSEIKFTKLDLTDLANISIFKGDVQVKIGGSHNLTKKLNNAINILKEVDMKKGYIDITTDGNPILKKE